jgi:hypothetical protein
MRGKSNTSDASASYRPVGGHLSCLEAAGARRPTAPTFNAKPQRTQRSQRRKFVCLSADFALLCAFALTKKWIAPLWHSFPQIPCCARVGTTRIVGIDALLAIPKVDANPKIGQTARCDVEILLATHTVVFRGLPPHPMGSRSRFPPHPDWPPKLVAAQRWRGRPGLVRSQP